MLKAENNSTIKESKNKTITKNNERWCIRYDKLDN